MSTRREPRPNLSHDEIEDYESSERGEWVSVGDIDARREHWRKLAKGAGVEPTLAVAVELPEADLRRLTTIAERRGVRTEALIVSILHDYADR